MRYSIQRILCVLVLLCTFDALSAEVVYINFEDGRVLTARMLALDAETVTIQPLEGGPPEFIRKSEIKSFVFYASEDVRAAGRRETGWNLYLRNGEMIEGNITQFAEDYIAIESLSGSGALQLPTNEIKMITSKNTRLQMDRRVGIGYVQNKSTLNATKGPFSYNSDYVSYRFFLSDETFGNLLFAYGRASHGKNKLEILTLDYKMGFVMKRVQNTLLYWAASGGYIVVNDTENDVDGSGFSTRAMLGMEIFFNSIPNFGFSGEVGIGYKKVGDYEVTDLSTSNFPSFSIHYYF